MNVQKNTVIEETGLQAVFDQQQRAFTENSYPDYAERLEDLDKLDELLRENEEKIIQAIDADFGCRSTTETVLAEIIGCYSAIRYAQKNLRKWMRPRKRHTSIWSKPAKSSQFAQPLGVIGVMAPWNYSLHLSFAPLIAAIAAGNRVMLCMSEETPRLNGLMQDLISRHFDISKIAVYEGGADFSPRFAALPFDHLLFTGSTRVGRLIAQAAAKNLTPVTLELGGKSPAIVAPDYDIQEAAHRICWGKSFNAGQICIAPDYALVPEGKQHEFAQAMLNKFGKSYKGLLDPDFTAIISERFFFRLRDMVEEAKQAGATVLQPDGVTESVVQGVYKFPLTIVLDAPAHIRLMQEEIFGPVLPVLTYSETDNILDHVNGVDRPLSLYCFSEDVDFIRLVQRKTVSSSIGVNECLLQYAQEDLPFGGVGESGQGAYHGREGFDSFSHLKSTFVQKGLGNFTGAKMMYPPYGPVARILLKMMRVL